MQILRHGPGDAGEKPALTALIGVLSLLWRVAVSPCKTQYASASCNLHEDQRKLTQS
jgi:hypothetical protein